MGSTVEDAVTPGQASSTPRPGVWLTEGALVLMALIWGVNYSVVKFGATLVDPYVFNGTRLMLAAVLLVAILIIARTPLPPWRVIAGLLALGVLGNGVYQFLFVAGIARTRASDVALVVAASPAFIALIGRARGVEHVGRWSVVGIALSIAGIGLVVLGSTQTTGSGTSLAGDLIVLVGSLAWAVYTVLLKPYTEQVSGLTLSAFTMIGGAVPVFLLALPAIARTPWHALPAMAWVAVLYSGAGSLVLAYFFWYRGIRVLGPTRASMFGNLQPVVAVLFAWIMLGERPTAWQGTGMASIMAGLLLTRMNA